MRHSGIGYQAAAGAEDGGGNRIIYEAVGLITRCVMGSRKAGRVKYAPLRRYNGGEAGSRPGEKKTQTGRFVFFLPYGPRLRAGGCASPFESLRDGFATGGNEAERNDRREQTPPIFFQAGEARRRGGGTIQAAIVPPLEYACLAGCAALGGVGTLSSPRCWSAGTL
jgi:hypothetical protein